MRTEKSWFAPSMRMEHRRKKIKCNYPITDCANYPIRKEWKNEQSYVDNGQSRELS